jgi:hypothetical protein
MLKPSDEDVIERLRQGHSDARDDGADNELMVWLVIPAVVYLRAFFPTRHNLT